jgi:hypothetical protein
MVMQAQMKRILISSTKEEEKSGMSRSPPVEVTADVQLEHTHS